MVNGKWKDIENASTTTKSTKHWSPHIKNGNSTYPTSYIASFWDYMEQTVKGTLITILDSGQTSLNVFPTCCDVFPVISFIQCLSWSRLLIIVSNLPDNEIPLRFNHFLINRTSVPSTSKLSESKSGKLKNRPLTLNLYQRLFLKDCLPPPPGDEFEIRW